jgi:hypothetical protein
MAAGKIKIPARGAIAQLGERIVRNDEVVGSIPTSSTKFPAKFSHFLSLTNGRFGLFSVLPTKTYQLLFIARVRSPLP